MAEARYLCGACGREHTTAEVELTAADVFICRASGAAIQAIELTIDDVAPVNCAAPDITLQDQRAPSRS